MSGMTDTLDTVSGITLTAMNYLKRSLFALGFTAVFGLWVVVYAAVVRLHLQQHDPIEAFLTGLIWVGLPLAYLGWKGIGWLDLSAMDLVPDAIQSDS